MNTETKTVEGFFGQKQITKEEFVKQWKQHAQQLWNIACKRQDAEKVDAIITIVGEMAEAKWDQMK